MLLRPALCLLVAVTARAEKPPYRLLYNSDTTNILSCTSVWRPDHEKLVPEMFEKVVNEAADAGAQVFLMAPGLGWVPWWPSQVAPLEQHAAWFREHFHLPAAHTAFLDFALQGGDMVRLTADRCHQRSLAFFVSFRLNDVHGKDTFAVSPASSHIATVPRFYVEHPEYLLGPPPRGEQMSWAQYLQNWAIPEVRAYKFALLEELCRRYDLEGVELDFMRAPYFFRSAETSSAQRRDIMLGFISQVRHLLDATTAAGHHRWLSVRIPSTMEAYDLIGIDPAAWQAAGVEMFNLASFYDVEQMNDLAKIRPLVPTAALYLELTHVIAFSGGKQARSQRRTTTQLLETSGHLAYARGADGLSLFNFQYFREYRDAAQLEPDGPYTEPPFGILRTLADPTLLANRPQHYYQGMIMANLPRKVQPFPIAAKPAQPLKFALDLAPPRFGWQHSGRLRFQSDTAFGDQQIRVQLNGADLVPNLDVSEPYPNPYTQMLGRPAELRAWTVPPSVAHSGRNEITLTSMTGAPIKLIALDLAFP